MTVARPERGPSAAELGARADRARSALTAADAPSTLGELADRLEVPCDEVLGEKVVDLRLKDEALRFALKAKKGSARAVSPGEPVYARSALGGSALAHVLEHLLRHARGSSTAFSPTDLAERLRGGPSGPRGKWFLSTLRSALEAAELPSGFGAVRRNNAWVLFRLEDLVSSGRTSRTPAVQAETPPSPSGFAAAFDRAFDALDGEGRRLNYVKLHALRAALLDHDRAAFDAGLRQLRLAGRYALDPAEGTHDRLTDEERAAGIHEGSTRLVYCRRIR